MRGGWGGGEGRAPCAEVRVHVRARARLRGCLRGCTRVLGSRGGSAALAALAGALHNAVGSGVATPRGGARRASARHGEPPAHACRNYHPATAGTLGRPTFWPTSPCATWWSAWQRVGHAPLSLVSWFLAVWRFGGFQPGVCPREGAHPPPARAPPAGLSRLACANAPAPDRSAARRARHPHRIPRHLGPPRPRRRGPLRPLRRPAAGAARHRDRAAAGAAVREDRVHPGPAAGQAGRHTAAADGQRGQGEPRAAPAPLQQCF